MPHIKARPKPGTLLALRLTTIEANVATQFGREMFAPKLDYPTGRLFTEHSMLVEYLTTPPNRLQEAIHGEEIIWPLETDYDEFQEKWDRLFRPVSLAVITGKRAMFMQGMIKASCHANIERFLPNHVLHVKVDPRAQKLDQKISLQEHFTQNALVRISALDANQKTRLVFTGVILNVENDTKGNIVGYNVKREISKHWLNHCQRESP